MMIKILYIGNNLVKKTNYQTTMETLSSSLKKEGFLVIKTSSVQNKLLRMIAITFSTIKNSFKVNYILIDTFSTKNFYFALVSSQIARIFNIKYIPILHGGNLPSRIIKSKMLSRLIFKNSYKNIAPSNYLKHEFEKEGYKINFIPNILEIEKYTFKKREILKPNILWVRAFKELYNPILAIKVLNKVKKEFPTAKLCMIGPDLDDSFEHCKNLAKELGLENSVEFTGVLKQKEWHDKAKDFDIFINTTNFDNTPISVMEAMALGLVVLSTNVGGLPYLIDDKIDGFLVNKNDETKMSNQITNLLKHQNHIEITEKARNKVTQFSWQFVKHKWLSILK